MPEAIECPCCQEIVEALTVEGECESCSRRHARMDRLRDERDEACEPDHVVRTCAPAEE